MKMNEWIVKHFDRMEEETGIKIIKQKGYIEICEYVDINGEEKTIESVRVEMGIELDNLIRYLKEIREVEG